MTNQEKINYRLDYAMRAYSINRAIMELKLKEIETDEVAALVRQASIQEMEKIRDNLIGNCSSLLLEDILK